MPLLRLARRANPAAIDVTSRPESAIEALAARCEQLYRDGRMAEAEAACRKLAAALPDNPMAHYNLARVLKDRGKTEAAAQSLRRALGLAPALVEGWLNLGTLLGESGKMAEAAQAFESGLTVAPQSWQMLTSLGRVRVAQGRPAEAESLLRRSLDLAPEAPPTLVNLGNLLSDRGEQAQALALFERALAKAPAMTEALMGAGNALRKVGEHGRAIACYARAAEAKPHDLPIRARLAEARLAVCDWSGIETLRTEVIEPALKSPGAVPPMMSLTFPLELASRELLIFARQRAETVAAEVAPLKAQIRTPKPGPRDRLTIGYMSGDFHDHPTAHLMRSLFAAHDRAQVRIVTLATASGDGSDYREVIRTHSDAFVELAGRDTLDAARAIQAESVDILVDINVHTRGNRLDLSSLRPAPVAINWLGLPGTSGAACMDWVLTDAVTCPPGQETDFSETVAVLPHCYQCNDRDQAIPQQAPGRAECGLPDGAFVFGCFNQAFKIEPVVFGRWMRILGRVPGSVLWLLAGSPEMEANLRREAEARGIAPHRLVFAGRQPKPAHLARHRHMDLFLDTLFYNAHTTASDALWAGVPVITRPGRNFGARVAASLLTQVGLPELIRPDLDAYEDLAVRLATRPDELAGVKARLAANRLTTPLFDTRGFARDMERAFRLIWGEACAGRKPKRLEIPAAG